jgi:hypothetical protein
MAYPNGFLGIKTSEVDPIKGSIGERDLVKEHLYVRRTLKCSTPATARPAPSALRWPQRKTLHETAIKIFAATDYPAALAPGLLLYCKLNGLPLD